MRSCKTGSYLRLTVDKMKLILFFNCLAIFTIPRTLCLDMMPACPSNCTCYERSGYFECIGRLFRRLPSIPPSFTHLSISKSIIEEFSLKDLSPHLKTVSLSDMVFQSFDQSGPQQPSNVTRLQIDGCCSGKFPNLSNFVHLTQLSYSVKCESKSAVEISGELIGNMGVMSKDRSLPSAQISNSCIASITPSALRLLLKFKKINFSHNRLSNLSIGEFAGTLEVKLLDVSMNPSFKKLDLQSTKLHSLTATGTTVNISEITASQIYLTKLLISQRVERLKISELCKVLPDIIHLTANQQLLLDVSEVSRCKYLEVLEMSNSRQTVLPNFLGTKIYQINAESNLYSKLNFSLFPSTSRLNFHLKDNRIETIDFANCDVLRLIQTLDLTKNKINFLSSAFLYCLREERKSYKLLIGENPMRDIFTRYNGSVKPRVRLEELRMSAIEKIQEVGRLPKLFIQHFAKIEHFFADRNDLKSLPETIAVLRNTGLHANMVTLNLEQNKFSEVPKLLFFRFRMLSKLDLSSNKISTIGASAFVDLPKLETLDLSENKLVNLQPWLNDFPIDIKLDLSQNRFDCKCPSLQSLKTSRFLLLLNSTDSSEKRGLVCASPKTFQYFPIVIAVRETADNFCPQNIIRNTPPPTTAPPTTPPKSVMLITIVGVLSGLLILIIVVVVLVVISRKRKMSDSYTMVPREKISAV